MTKKSLDNIKCQLQAYALHCQDNYKGLLTEEASPYATATEKSI